MSSSIAIRPLSVQDYHQMVEFGILQPDERVELLEGQIIQMAAKGTTHSAAVSRCTFGNSRVLGVRCIGRVLDLLF